MILSLALFGILRLSFKVEITGRWEDAITKAVSSALVKVNTRGDSICQLHTLNRKITHTQQG